MSQHGDDAPAPVPALARAPAPAPADAGRTVHARSFKLRFAAQREAGRSNVSAVKPFGLPATVAGNPQRREQPGAAEAVAEAAALRAVQAMFARGPRDRHANPLTSAHQYGWWWDKASEMAATKFSDRRLHHHIHDSSWLKARLLVLAADDKLKPR